jgi:hypothetical protein
VQEPQDGCRNRGLDVAEFDFIDQESDGRPGSNHRKPDGW